MEFDNFLDDTRIHTLMSSEEFEDYILQKELMCVGYEGKLRPITSRAFFAIEDGWLSLVKFLIDHLLETGWCGELIQVKEKFGNLRFYPVRATSEQYEFISKCEELSTKICEKCSQPGENYMTHTRWIYTFCPEHKEEMKERMINIKFKEP